MFRGWCTCFLILGVTVVATGDSFPINLPTRQVEPISTDSGTEVTPLGLQVEVGRGNVLLVSSHSRNRAVWQTGQLNGPATEPLRNPLEQFDGNLVLEQAHFVAEEGISHEHTWQVLPPGIMYKSYLAGEKESRVQSVWLTDRQGKLVWETALGGRYCFVRHGTSDPVDPEGWQMDFEGAAQPRVDPKSPSSPLIAADFRIGLLSTWRQGPNAFKAGYYHLSSHLGDEFLLLNPDFVRLNYVRDAVIVGWTRFLTAETQVYGEVAYAFNHEDGALPLELQYGIQYSPRVPGPFGAPFGGINGHTREDFNYQTSVNVMAGWQWWSEQSNHTFRVGLQYYDGPSLQYSFVNKHETLMGWGLWFDY